MPNGPSAMAATSTRRCACSKPASARSRSGSKQTSAPSKSVLLPYSAPSTSGVAAELRWLPPSPRRWVSCSPASRFMPLYRTAGCKIRRTSFKMRSREQRPRQSSPKKSEKVMAEKAEAAAKKMEAAANEALAAKEAAQAEAARIRRDAQKTIAETAKGLGPRPTGTYAEETTSFGVSPPDAPVQKLTGPTPTTVPEGKVLTTAQLWEAIAGKTLGSAIFLVDVGNDAHSKTIPGASRLPAAGEGTMDGAALTSVWSELSKLTGSNFDVPLVFFGADVKDWAPYNAALRAINMGYGKVYWYRGRSPPGRRPTSR